MIVLEDNFIFNDSKEPFKFCSIVYEELQRLTDSIKYYKLEIKDLNKNNYHSHFPECREVDPIHEILNEPMTLTEYINKLKKINDSSKSNEIIIQPYIDNGERLQRSEIIIPLDPPTLKDIKNRIKELNLYIKNTEEKISLLLKEIDKANLKNN